MGSPSRWTASVARRGMRPAWLASAVRAGRSADLVERYLGSHPDGAEQVRLGILWTMGCALCGLALTRCAIIGHRNAGPDVEAALSGRGLNTTRLNYRVSFFYDLAKAAVNRMAFALAHELQPYGATAVSLTPGWLRSEAMLEAYGVTESNWRDATKRSPHFAISENPAFVGRAVAALAQDPDVSALDREVARPAGSSRRSSTASTDIDGSQPRRLEVRPRGPGRRQARGRDRLSLIWPPPDRIRELVVREGADRRGERRHLGQDRVLEHRVVADEGVEGADAADRARRGARTARPRCGPRSPRRSPRSGCPRGPRAPFRSS